MRTDEIEEYYLLKFTGGKIHISPRMGSLTTLCGRSTQRYHDGYIKGNGDFLAKFVAGPYGCLHCRHSLEIGTAGFKISIVRPLEPRLCIQCGAPLWDIESIRCNECSSRGMIGL